MYPYKRPFVCATVCVMLSGYVDCMRTCAELYSLLTVRKAHLEDFAVQGYAIGSCPGQCIGLNTTRLHVTERRRSRDTHLCALYRVTQNKHC